MSQPPANDNVGQYTAERFAGAQAASELPCFEFIDIVAAEIKEVQPLYGDLGDPIVYARAIWTALRNRGMVAITLNTLTKQETTNDKPC